MGNRKLPFGYKMVMGEIVIHPQEAQAVQGIYARYLAGASFNDITDHLKEKGPSYDVDKLWNKNMVARILEDTRYTGQSGYPAIIRQEMLERALENLPVDEADKNRIARLSAELMAQAEQYAVELGIQAYLEFTRTLTPEMRVGLEGHKDNGVPET